jgi:hypothetical protein
MRHASHLSNVVGLVVRQVLRLADQFELPRLKELLAR